MANYVETLLINEGPATFTLQTFLQSDGQSGELVDFPIVYYSDFTPPMSAKACMSLWKVWYQVSNFTVTFSWRTAMGASDPVWVLAPGVDSRHDFSDFGGIVDSSGNFATGALLITTRGFTQSNSTGSFVLRMRKLDNVVPQYKLTGQTLGVSVSS